MSTVTRNTAQWGGSVSVRTGCENDDGEEVFDYGLHHPLFVLLTTVCLFDRCNRPMPPSPKLCSPHTASPPLAQTPQPDLNREKQANKWEQSCRPICSFLNCRGPGRLPRVSLLP
ncbi:hypothetical protein DPEC_G00006960 [Dallia pectoralis]|uniref:Uncharacterized protein n=1 Tax=Dallia pectoralis TaxID=75939 RepID=A0ACC2HKM1_DALPE|nr:hypothetical protein DPEC_G00006960 [Dallia pectoralis]